MTPLKTDLDFVESLEILLASKVSNYDSEDYRIAWQQLCQIFSIWRNQNINVMKVYEKYLPHRIQLWGGTSIGL